MFILKCDKYREFVLKYIKYRYLYMILYDFISLVCVDKQSRPMSFVCFQNQEHHNTCLWNIAARGSTARKLHTFIRKVMFV